MATSLQVTFDCADPDRQAAFWAAVLGYVEQPPPDGYADWDQWLKDHDMVDVAGTVSAIVDPGGAGPRIYFQKVPESKIAKNRVHLDVRVAAGLEGVERRSKIDAEVERVTGLGATALVKKEEHGQYWVVMHDPEGNEFCLD